MPPRDPEYRIQDILNAIDKILTYVEDLDYQAFIEDAKTVDSVLLNFIVIGEAASHIPEDVMEKHPEIPWYEMRSMRNVIAHI